MPSIMFYEFSNNSWQMTISSSCNKTAGVLRTCSEVDLGIVTVWWFNDTPTHLCWYS